MRLYFACVKYQIDVQYVLSFIGLPAYLNTFKCLVYNDQDIIIF